MSSPAQTVRDLDYLVAKGLTDVEFQTIHHRGGLARIAIHRSYCEARDHFQTGSKNIVVGERLAHMRLNYSSRTTMTKLASAARRVLPMPGEARPAKAKPALRKRGDSHRTKSGRGDDRNLDALCREVVQCRTCFSDGLAKPAFVDLAQPRWVGPHYSKSTPRTLILMLNPGRGAYNSASDQELRKLSRAYRAGTVALPALFDHQRRDMPGWGGRPGRFTNFYLDGMGLELDQIAFANIAWCADQDDSYPGEMLQNCFDRHTTRLLRLLAPEVVVLSGSKTKGYRQRISEILPDASLVTTIHYAHRLGQAREAEELRQVRSALAR